MLFSLVTYSPVRRRKIAPASTEPLHAPPALAPVSPPAVSPPVGSSSAVSTTAASVSTATASASVPTRPLSPTSAIRAKLEALELAELAQGDASSEDDDEETPVALSTDSSIPAPSESVPSEFSSARSQVPQPAEPTPAGSSAKPASAEVGRSRPPHFFFGPDMASPPPEGTMSPALEHALRTRAQLIAPPARRTPPSRPEPVPTIERPKVATPLAPAKVMSPKITPPPEPAPPRPDAIGEQIPTVSTTIQQPQPKAEAAQPRRSKFFQEAHIDSTTE
ncbi:hypothetical protein PAPYR_9104 [Paratrimastix pyriformis]|uniref:Uncharacterized protein n=1 Tax=Paratrimastix pyriformis TaxID=342808 RepID=A0ABQ8U9C2_9EUKA|nr:hypothetical protein PAPYR_9104 [Paratrimastix pyriformis]